MGDACDADIDGDGLQNASDNCPYAHNPDQLDSDGDSLGNACDNCPLVANASQSDVDANGIGDVCDPCTDTDQDGYGDPGYAATTCTLDNCPDISNPNQADADADGSAMFATTAQRLSTHSSMMKIKMESVMHVTDYFISKVICCPMLLRIHRIHTSSGLLVVLHHIAGNSFRVTSHTD